MIGNGIGIPFQRKRGGAAPFVGLLDEYPGAVAAYDMRLLTSAYTGAIKYVRTFDGSSDQGTAGILGHKIGDEYWLDLNSKLTDLDATALGRGLTENDTLADLVDAGGANYDGFVAVNNDVSGNGNDHTITNASEQYRVVIAGDLVTDNGKPACFHRNLEKSTAEFLLGNTVVSAQVGRITEDVRGWSDGFNTNINSLLSLNNSSIRFYNDATGFENGNFVKGNQHLITFINNQGAGILGVDDVEVSGTLGNIAMQGVTIGGLGQNTTPNNQFEGYMQCNIYWVSASIWNDISSIREKINNAYNIYTP